ncbi:extracellular solute-binding protein [Gracilibacillus salitolerans]|uniref:Extracellular solute-binding protein n=1 Tax=Gracilibacillus salitolerans TaxID=2663022 RepID=A0A5Q2TS24_9BACI|nr:extracellular solute-binding protein [Gracilibacillus salitolerans]QGH35568.1 extracellular solute-binding protein [Gracilibacillus salitolerans]
MRSRVLGHKLLLFIVASILFLVITACQSSETNESESENEEPDNSEGEDSGDQTDISISMRTLGFIHVENHSNINEDEYVKKLEEITNVDLDITLVPHSEFEQKMDLMFASGDIPDVVATSGAYGGGDTMRDAVDAGVFLPLDELIEEHGPNLLEEIPQAAWDAVTYDDGVIYAIPEFLGNPSRRATIVRADLLEEADIPIPTTPEEAWTVEETLDVLRTFKEMGIEQPYSGRAEFKYSDTFFGAFDAFAYDSQLELVDNQVQPKFFNEENMTTAIQTYKTMYDEGLIHPEFLTHEYNDYKNAGLSGKAGMWSMNANELLQWQGQLEESVPDGELAIIPSPRGTDGEGGYYLYGSVPRSYMINKEAEDKAVEIIKFLDWMLSEEAETFFSYGIEDKDYEMDGDQVNYHQPETNDEINIERYRTGWLWLIKDTTYYANLLELSEEGKQLMETYDTILANEGRDGIRYIPGLRALDDTPNLSSKSDVPAPFLMEHMAKMITGAEEIDDWSNVVDEWVDRGGDKLLEEAQERYENGDYLEPRR